MEWLISCNTRYYDIDTAFEDLSVLDWKQAAKEIQVGDGVYIYVGKPVSAIKYKCIVNKTGLKSIEIDDAKYVINGATFENYGRYMELQLVRKYADELKLPNLRKHGLVGNIQGPRRAIKELSEFINSIDDNVEEKLQSVCHEIDQTAFLGSDREAIVKARVNQGIFRDVLVKRYGEKCCLCGVTGKSFLVASHIKPWSDSSPEERTDVNNGLLLCPNHDKLFDGGWVSFDAEGIIMISEKLENDNRIFLNVNNQMHIELTEGNKKYLKYHREKVLQK